MCPKMVLAQRWNFRSRHHNEAFPALQHLRFSRDGTKRADVETSQPPIIVRIRDSLGSAGVMISETIMRKDPGLGAGEIALLLWNQMRGRGGEMRGCFFDSSSRWFARRDPSTSPGMTVIFKRQRFVNSYTHP